MKLFKAAIVMIICFQASIVLAKTDLNLVDSNYECEQNPKNTMEWQISECIVSKAGSFDLPLDAAYKNVLFRANQSDEADDEKQTILKSVIKMHESWLEFRDRYCEAESMILYTRPVEINLNEEVCKQQLNKKQVGFYNELN